MNFFSLFSAVHFIMSYPYNRGYVGLFQRAYFSNRKCLSFYYFPLNSLQQMFSISSLLGVLLYL